MGQMGYLFDPSVWNFFPFDLGNDLNNGTFVVILDQNDKQELGDVGCLYYDGKSFLKVYNLLDGPKLCMNDTFNKDEYSSKKGSNEHCLDVDYAKASNL